MSANTCVYLGEALGRYGFGHGHPFSPARLEAFEKALRASPAWSGVTVCKPRVAERAVIEYFHAPSYVDQVIRQSETGEGYLDGGDTPAFAGVYQAAATVVGSVADAVARLMRGECRRAFVPIAGLHHAARNRAAGFCVFNDCGVALELLRREYSVKRIAYVDIDAHHGDGVFYAFEDDPELCVVDMHEDGRYLYPGTGAAQETGRGAATSTKMNIPLPPYADDEAFAQGWKLAEHFLEQARPEFILLQCGADSLAGDPITHLAYTERSHRLAAASLCRLADKYAGGRILGVGGGGYNLDNLGRAWTAVVSAFLNSVPEEQ